MTTGYDVSGLIPQIRPCPDCGQADPMHLTVCPQLGPVQGVTPETVAAVDEHEKELGAAV
jgi:hypothetical protein